MAAVPTPYHNQGSHGAVISTTAGTAIKHLEKVIRERDSSWFEVSPVSSESLGKFGLADYFDLSGNIIPGKLPQIYQMPGVVVTGSRCLSAGSLWGLNRLLALQPEALPVSDNFKSFAIGVFLRCPIWDKAEIHGLSSQIPLDMAFACVGFALADAKIYTSQKITENFKNLWAQINEEDSPLLRCATGRRHDLVGVLGAAQYPGVLIFADELEFIEQCVDEFLRLKYVEHSVRPLVGDVDPANWLSLLLPRIRLSESSPAGAGSSASDLEKPLQDFVAEARFFVLRKMAEVGFDGESNLFAVKLNERLPLGEWVEVRDTCMAYLRSRQAPLSLQATLALKRIAYLKEKFPASAAWAFIHRQDPAKKDFLTLGEEASQLSEYLDLLKQMDHLGVVTEAQAAAVERLKLALLPLIRSEPLEAISEILSPSFAAASEADRRGITELIREKASGRNGFIANFFALRALAVADEDQARGVAELIRHLKNLLSMDSPVTDEWMEGYQSRHRDGVILTLDPLTLNLILLHALRTPASERTSAFSGALVQVIAFIRRSFIENEGEVPGGLGQALKRDSYPEELLTLVESGGRLPGLYPIQSPETFWRMICELVFAELPGEVSLFLRDFMDPECSSLMTVSEGLLEGFVVLLSGETPRGKEYAAFACANLAFDLEYKTRIGESSGVIQGLVKLLSGGTSRQKEQAARALGNLACDHWENQIRIGGASGVITGLVELLSEGSRAEKEGASALWNLAYGHLENQTRIGEAFGVIEGLVALLLSGGASEAKFYAAGALGGLACNHSRNQTRIGRAAGAIEGLAVLFSTGTPTAKEAALETLRSLALGHPENQTRIARTSGEILELLSIGDPCEKDRVAMAFYSRREPEVQMPPTNPPGHFG